MLTKLLASTLAHLREGDRRRHSSGAAPPLTLDDQSSGDTRAQLELSYIPLPNLTLLLSDSARALLALALTFILDLALTLALASARA